MSEPSSPGGGGPASEDRAGVPSGVASSASGLASSPSGFASSASQLEKRKYAQAADVVAHLRKLLDGYRLYTPEHSTLKGFQETFYGRLTAYLQEHEELPLAVTAATLAVDGHTVFSTDKREESLSHALFLDGLKLLTFARGVKRDEVDTITRLWRDALDGKTTADQNFVTRFWELDFEHAKVLAVETFAEDAEEGAGTNRSKDKLEVLIGDLVAQQSAGEGRAVRRMQVTREDLEVLKMKGVADLTADDLAQHADAATAKALQGLTREELAQVRAELLEPEAVRLERTLHALAWATQAATPAQTAQLMEALRALMKLLAEGRRLDVISLAFKNAVLAVRAAPAGADARIRVVKQASENLGHPAVLEAVLPLLDEPATAESALAVLRFLQPSAIAALLDRLGTLKTREGRARLVELLAAGATRAEDVAARLPTAPEEVAELLLSLVKETDPKWWFAMKAAMAHPGKAVRRAAVQRLTREKVLALRFELYALAGGDDPEIRNALLPRLVSAKDPGVVPVIARLLGQRAKLDDAERKSLVVALGVVGGEAACNLLKRELENEAEALELRCAAALALGSSGDERCRPALEAYAKKLLGRGPLKDACAEGLKRLDAHRPGGKAP